MFLRIPGEEKSESYKEILSPEEKTGQTRTHLMSMIDTWIKKQSKP